MHVELADLHQIIGQELEPSDWVTVDQTMIDGFADVTGDHAWYHCDVERATRELPEGATIAHGLLSLSLLPALKNQVLSIGYPSRALNYGYELVRFPSPVVVGSRVRLHVTVLSADSRGEGTLIVSKQALRIENHDKPAVAARQMVYVLP